MKDQDRTKKQLMAELVEMRQRIAELEAVDIQRRQVEEEIEQRNQELAALNRELSLLLEASKAVSSSLELDEVLYIMAQKLTELAKVTCCRVALLDETGENLIIHSAYPIVKELDWEPRIGQRYPLDAVPWQRKVIDTGEPQLWHKDYSPPISETELMVSLAPGVKAVALLPVILRGQVIGAVSLGERRSWERSPLDTEKIGLCQAMISEMAMAIENARLYEAAQQEIAERKRVEEAIKQMVYQDDLTGLPNRRLFNDRLTLELARAQRNRAKLAVMSLDLDYFKVINDTLGHSVGDQLLQAVGDRLTSLLRKSDTVARMGGDEFMVLLPETAEEEGAIKISQKILEAIREPFVFDSHELHVTTSIGFAMYPKDGEDGDTLMKNADKALYHAKDRGRDRYQRYIPAMRAEALE